LIIPINQTEYDKYASIRTAVLAIPQSSILGFDGAYAPLNSDGNTYGIHPACPELRTLFGEGKLAMLFNTGTLLFLPLGRSTTPLRPSGRHSCSRMPTK
jgi:hypothetical protein